MRLQSGAMLLLLKGKKAQIPLLSSGPVVTQPNLNHQRMSLEAFSSLLNDSHSFESDCPETRTKGRNSVSRQLNIGCASTGL